MNGISSTSGAGNKGGSSVPSISPGAPAKMHDDLGTSPAAEPELPHLHLHHSDHHHHQQLAQQEYYLRSAYEQQYAGYAFYSHPEPSYYTTRDAALMHPPLMHAPYDGGDEDEEEEEDEHGTKRRALSPGSVDSGSSAHGAAIGGIGDCCNSLSMHHHHLHPQEHAPYMHHEFSGMLPLIRPDLAHHHHGSPHQHPGAVAQIAGAHAAAAAAASLSSSYAARVPDSRSARIRMMRAAAASINERSNAYKTGSNNAGDSAHGSDDDMHEFPIAKLAGTKLSQRQTQPSLVQQPQQHQQHQHQSIPRATQQHKPPTRRASVSSSTHEGDSTAAAAEPGSLSGGNPNSNSGDRKTSARRAEQNRTAQRAFRERRQHYVKDLEAKAAQADTLDSRISQADCRLADIQSIAERLAADREGWMREREMWWRERDEAVSLANSLVTELDVLNKENCRFREVLDGLSSAVTAGKGELPANLLPMAQLALQLQISGETTPGSRKRTITELEFEDMIMAAPMEHGSNDSNSSIDAQKRFRTSSSSSTCGSASDGEESANVAALRDLLKSAHAKHANQPMSMVEPAALSESSSGHCGEGVSKS
ncbi:hypothetical protein HDU87_007395 [Geranomyces variabilis]|uniref:BZIP domain-containing protein n=1 Tax=Geranomyces variabilis TaxID=109894 RepID=A0AAD5XPS6_9FUNG|nr:hypothetical protein HDU87_007395 [Geranomyces variabilis]